MNMFRAFMELDEAYNNRQALIDDIKKSGKSYNFDKYTDAQLYRMWQRLQKPKPNKITKEPSHELDLDFDIVTHEYCDCGARLSDAGFCPVCQDGEEDLAEGIFDAGPVTRAGFVTASGQKVTLPRRNASMSKPTSPAAPNPAPSSNKYIVRIVSDKGRLRALATDGVNPAAWVSFPNDLRQYEGQRYEVDELIWNGKNYRVSGDIIEI